MAEIKVTLEDNAVIIRPIGRLDLDGMNKFKQAISGARQSGSKYVIADLAECVQIGSTLIHNLVAPIKALFLMEGKLAFVNASKHERLLKNSMIGSMVIFADSVEEAMTALNSPDE